MPAPDNEAILEEIEEAEKYIKGLLKRVIDLDATPHTLHVLCESLAMISRCYAEPLEHSHNIGVAGVAISRNSNPIREVDLPEDLQQKIFNTIRQHYESSPDDN